MARVKGGTIHRARRKKVMDRAKGYFGSKHRLYKSAKEQVMHSGKYAYRDRRQKKRDFRKLWITRINAACRENEISYSRFIEGLNKAGVEVNRKMLSEIAIADPKAFAELVKTAKKGLEGKAEAAKKVEAKKEVEVVKGSAKKETKKEEVKEEKKETAKKPAAKKETVKKEVKEDKKEEKKAPVKKAAAKPVEKKTTTAKKTTKKETK